MDLDKTSPKPDKLAVNAGDDPKPHPAAESFPLMDEKRFEEFKADIAAVGLRDPITLCDGMVLDGRNRLRACVELGITPQTREYDGNPWEYVWSLNGERRDLVTEQRYQIWKHCTEHGEQWEMERERIARQANEKRSRAAKKQPRTETGEFQPVVGQHDPLPADRHLTREAKARLAAVSPSVVKRGDQLARERPDLAEQVRIGKIKPAAAHRQMRKDSVADRVAALPPDKFRVIYADPPWSYNDKQAGSISESYGAAEKHYPSMSMAELKALDVAKLAADDAVLFLWVTSPMVPQGLELCSAWGFKYKTMFVWYKIKHNMGHYNSVRHELLLLATRGSCVPDNPTLFNSVQIIERTGKHSEKPAEFRQIIDTLYPHGKRIELFARSEAEGWCAWGNESQ